MLGGGDNDFDRENWALHNNTDNIIMTKTAPPRAPLMAETRILTGSVCVVVIAPDLERVKPAEGGFGHVLFEIPWAEHAARMVAANTVSINERFR